MFGFGCVSLHCGALPLCCSAQAFSRCDEQGLVSNCGAWASRCGGFSCCGAQALGAGA